MLHLQVKPPSTCKNEVEVYQWSRGREELKDEWTVTIFELILYLLLQTYSLANGGMRLSQYYLWAVVETSRFLQERRQELARFNTMITPRCIDAEDGDRL